MSVLTLSDRTRAACPSRRGGVMPLRVRSRSQGRMPSCGGHSRTGGASGNAVLLVGIWEWRILACDPMQRERRSHGLLGPPGLLRRIADPPRRLIRAGRDDDAGGSGRGRAVTTPAVRSRLDWGAGRVEPRPGRRSSCDPMQREAHGERRPGPGVPAYPIVTFPASASTITMLPSGIAATGSRSVSQTIGMPARIAPCTTLGSGRVPTTSATG
jgi:hypothetical protein